jgi:hypothetical protein
MGGRRAVGPGGLGALTQALWALIGLAEILGGAARWSKVGIWMLTASVGWAGRVRVQDQKVYGASAAAFRRLAGALQKATQLP